MKALTITQPWATLIAIGAKNFETRGWRTHIRGPVAIHAGMTLGPVGGKSGLAEICGREPFRRVLAAAGYETPADLPLGTILCTTQLLGCRPVEELAEDDAMFCAVAAPYERAFGNYTRDAGRFAFHLAAERTAVDVGPVRGGRKFWNWDEEAK